MAEEKNNNLNRNDAITLLNEGKILGRLRTVHSEHPEMCPGFSYEPNLISMGTDIPFSCHHFDLDALFRRIPSEHFIVGCINYSSRRREIDIQFMVTGKIEPQDYEIEGQRIQDPIRIAENARVREINEEISIDCLDLDGVNKIDADMKTDKYNNNNPLPPPAGISSSNLDSIFINQKEQINAENGMGGDRVAVGSYIHIDTAENAVNFLENLGNTQGHTDAGIVGICVVNGNIVRDKILDLVKINVLEKMKKQRIQEGWDNYVTILDMVIEEADRRQNRNSPMRRIKSKSSSCRDCKLYLSQFLVKDLKKIAKQFDCKNSSNMTKSELIKYILAHHKK